MEDHTYGTLPELIRQQSGLTTPSHEGNSSTTAYILRTYVGLLSRVNRYHWFRSRCWTEVVFVWLYHGWLFLLSKSQQILSQPLYGTYIIFNIFHVSIKKSAVKRHFLRPVQKKQIRGATKCFCTRHIFIFFAQITKNIFSKRFFLLTQKILMHIRIFFRIFLTL